MKILALIGSPRKGSNTDLLVDQILMGAQSKGHTITKFYLYDIEILPCIDCRKCKEDDYKCVLVDDMQELYPKLQDTDCIIFGTPIYWYGPTGKMKLFLDRLRPFIANKGLRKKKGIVVIPSAEGSKACGPLLEMFRMSFAYLGIEFVKSLLVKAYERGEISKNQEELKRAYILGEKI